MVIHKPNSDLLADPTLKTKLGRMSGLGDILYYLNAYKEYLLNIFFLLRTLRPSYIFSLFPSV